MNAGTPIAGAAEQADTGLRRRYLRWPDGAANVGWLLLMHGTLFAWLWSGRGLVPYPAFLVISLCLCTVHQRILSEWFHEATHWNLLPGRAANDVCADLLIGTLNGTRVASNRPGHFRHHAASAFFLPDDPDTRDAAARTRGELLWGLGRDLAGITALRAFLQAAGGGRGSLAGRVAWFAWLAGIHLAGLAGTIIAGRPDIYPLWFGSLLCLYPVANRFRLYGQHAELDAGGKPRLVGSRASRTLHAGLLEQLLLNSPMIMYHHEHHARPALPYRALRAIATPSADPNVAGSGCLRILSVVLGRLGT